MIAWSNIVEQEAPIAQLKNALASGRLAGAYLFAGLRGVGKRRTADALAGALLCPHRTDAGACGSCAACRKCAEGNHPDLFVVLPEALQPDWKPPPGKDRKPSEEIKIERIRELQGELQFHPLEAKAKLAIIDEADRMTAAAANSLLKILEEPPEATHFVLVSALPHRLPATIRSRCQTIAFAPLSEGTIETLLAQRFEGNSTGNTRIARLSGGSIGAALAFDPELVDEVIGRFSALATGASSQDLLAAAEGWGREEPERIALILDLIASWYRDVLRYHVVGDAGALAHAEAAAAAAGIGPRRAERCLAEIARARAALEGRANKQLMFEHLLFTLAAA